VSVTLPGLRTTSRATLRLECRRYMSGYAVARPKKWQYIVVNVAGP